MNSLGDPGDKEVGAPGWHLRQTVTAFIDLLGLSNALEGLDRIVAEDLDKDSSTPIMRASVGRVRRFRRLFEDAYEAQRQRSVPPAPEVPEQLKDLWLKSFEHDTRITTFSDCILINVLVDQNNILATSRGILVLFASVSFATLSTMAEGQLVRGGIDAGVAIENGEQEVLGSGLVHAHRMESRVAVHPRVAIGPRIMGLLSALERSEGRTDIQVDSKQAQILRGTVRMIRSMIEVDLDGVPRLSFGHAWMLEAFRAGGQQDSLRQIAALFDKQASKLDPARDGDHLRKVMWARNILLQTAEREASMPA